VTSATSVPTGNTYDKYAATNPIERRLVEGFLARLERALDRAEPTRILEVGVGEGEVARRVVELYPHAPLIGVDLPDAELARRWQSLELRPSFADIADLPFADRSFDLVLAIEVLEHVTNPEAALAELARVATRDVVISVPREPLWRAANMARGKYLRALGNTPGHVQHWSTRGFVRLVTRYFDVTSVSSPLPWTLIGARARVS
jgi:ubiquinone/menaquinone biosynthesis C-methylase UbiE